MSTTYGGRPGRDEAMEYYFKYIDLVQGEDVVGVLASQLDETTARLKRISEERSRHRYEPGKWSIRELLNHVSDAERVFAFRALWFARGFDGDLPGFDEKSGPEASRADDIAWAQHVEEFRAARSSTVALFRNLPADAWSKTGIASDNPVSVRALAYILAGHVLHHMAILDERYS